MKAAALALEEGERGSVPLPGGTGEPDGRGAAALMAELYEMRRITGILAEIPARAWESELGPAPGAAHQAGKAPPAAARLIPRTTGLATRTAGLSTRLAGLNPRLAGLGALAAVTLAFVVGSLTHPLSGGAGRPNGSNPASGAHVVLRSLPESGVRGQAVAYMLSGGRRMRLRISSLPPSRPGTYYELWLMTSTTDLVPVSSFRIGASRSGVLELILPENPTRFRYLDISLQRVGAGPGISSDSVLRGAIPA